MALGINTGLRCTRIHLPRGVDAGGVGPHAAVQCRDTDADTRRRWLRWLDTTFWHNAEAAGMTRELAPQRQPKRSSGKGRRPSSGRDEVRSTAPNRSDVIAPQISATRIIAEAWLTDRHRASTTTGETPTPQSSPWSGLRRRLCHQPARTWTGHLPLSEQGSGPIARRWDRRTANEFRDWVCSVRRFSC